MYSGFHPSGAHFLTLLGGESEGGGWLLCKSWIIRIKTAETWLGPVSCKAMEWISGVYIFSHVWKELLLWAKPNPFGMKEKVSEPAMSLKGIHSSAGVSVRIKSNENPLQLFVSFH